MHYNALFYYLVVEMIIEKKKEKEKKKSDLGLQERQSGRVLVIGGSNIDIKGKPFNQLERGTSNPGSINIALGGVGRNIAHNLALIGVPVIFLSVIGEDDWGRKILEDTREAGVEMEQVKISKKNSTGIYLAILDEKGEMQVAISDMKACEEISVRYIKSKEEIIRESDIVVMDTNLPEKSIKYISKICSEENIKLVVEPVSVEKSKKLMKVLDKIDYLTPNKEELESIAGGIKLKNNEDIESAVERLRNGGKGVKNIILTLAERGVYLSEEEMDRKSEKKERSKNRGKFIQPYKVESIEVTGVGDALVAGLVYGIFKGFSLDIAVRYGLAAAALTISTPYTVNRAMNEEILRMVVKQKQEQR